MWRNISKNKDILYAVPIYCIFLTVYRRHINYDSFEELYLSKYYPDFKIIRTVILYGSNNEKIAEIEVGFLLNSNGKLILGVNAPKLIKRAIKNLLSYWT